MQILNFDHRTAQAMRLYGSQNIAFQRVAAEIPKAQLGVMYIDSGGVVGYHQAIGDQIFMVVQGSGWVTGEDRQHIAIEAGQAACWRDGEWHESGSEQGMVAVIVEGEKIEAQIK